MHIVKGWRLRLPRWDDRSIKKEFSVIFFIAGIMSRNIFEFPFFIFLFYSSLLLSDTGLLNFV